MKNRKIILLIIIILLVIIIGFVTIFKLTKKDNDVINSNSIQSSFSEEYKIENEDYINKDGEFNYSADIYSIEGSKELSCVNITFYDKDKNVVLSYNENVNLIVDNDNSYKISVNYPNDLNVDKVEYNLCE